MKKLAFLLIIAGFSLNTASSQILIALIFGDRLNTPNIEFGLNVGGNFTTLTDYPEAEYKSGINLGLYFNFKLSDHFYLHPELMLMNQLGSKGTDRRNLPGPEWDDESLVTQYSTNYGTLVFLPRYKLTNHMYFEAGIHGSYLFSAQSILQVQPEENTDLYYRKYVRDELTPLDFGVDVGLGYKFGKGDGVNLSLRYSRGFINILKDETMPAQYHTGFHIQVGIPIGVGTEDVKDKLDN
jgi:hypothetical protein